MSEFKDAEAGYEMVLEFDLGGPDFNEVEAGVFCLGFEFGKLYSCLRYDPGQLYDGWIHTSNVRRIEALCKELGRECSVVRVDDGWSHLEVEARSD